MSNRVRPTNRRFPVTQEDLSTTWKIRAENNGRPFRMRIIPGVIEIVFEQDMVLVN